MSMFQLNENADIDLSRSKILVVDDQPIHIQHIYELLSDLYIVLAATSGEEAIEVCTVNRPDLILLDVEMPRMSGIDTCQILKKIALQQRSPLFS